MLEELKEECGVVAIKLKKDISSYSDGGVVPYLYSALLALQHRGQLSSGFATLRLDGKGLYNPPFNDVGTVPEVFMTNKPEKYRDLLRAYSSLVGIGHNR